MIRKHLGFALNIVALGLFFHGILLTMFSFDMEMQALLSGSSLTSPLIDKELSIIATVEELWNDQRFMVAGLIFAFSVCIPLLKTILMCVAYFVKNLNLAKKILSFVSLIGKWSMADVFVVAIFLAILSTNHADTATTQTFNVFGFQISLEISTQTLSAVGEGFYYFTAYCIVSLLGSQLALSAAKKAYSNNKTQI
ncbi:paraquat-inducible protein A [Paraglaciecola aquimarina]|uniref:Paraquat-inducible protein A n=1 Tax=Paraglaciecola aquimarina TaxID=1235557 RepID=A0ABU3SSB2_9ALTE|nr:paraquat-inducible protein A [Paraglaciecola aquimarina]MDU0352910.1 paraquat-inducible protein A [Paraglaciecola aquimarina]